MAGNKEITKRSEDYAAWYLDVIKSADLADYAPVKGCMVIKPTGYALWEQIQQVLDQKFKDTGVENAYFPLLIPESYLKKEADHVEGFAPELAVVTHAGGKKLEEPLVLRPTSETVIYEMLSNWIESYKDLPVLLNQWANIIRWEKRTRLFLRTSEFLWQEGHTAHATKEEAQDRAKQMQGVYKEFAEEYLAIPVIDGVKSDSEKFAGAEQTLTIEAMMQDGKALQMGTSHLLDETFTNAFNIKYLDTDGKEKNIRASSWGVSTRLIGGLIMTHSDDAGLVLPPKIAPIQIVIVPVWVSEEDKKNVIPVLERLKAELSNEFRIKVDDRDMRPGPKFFEWEKKGVPLRIEIGPRDVSSNSVVLVRRDNGEKEAIAIDALEEKVSITLKDIQSKLFEKALEFREEKTKAVKNFEELKAQVEKGFAEAFWCTDKECENKVNEDLKATIRCIVGEVKEEENCAVCGKTSKHKVVFARSY